MSSLGLVRQRDLADIDYWLTVCGDQLIYLPLNT
jgi:hypothetical protein